MNKQSRVDGGDADLPTAARIRARLQRARLKFHANDNISAFIMPGEMEELLDDVSQNRAMALLEERVATGAIPCGDGGFD